jgi:hemerythrin-like domain-containing protein
VQRLNRQAAPRRADGGARGEHGQTAVNASVRRRHSYRSFPTTRALPAHHDVGTNQGERKMATREKDACDLLDADHRAVKKMFKEYEELTNSRGKTVGQKKMDLARQICQELTVHARIEEEIFYPALRAVFKDTDMLAEAEVEHQSAKDLIAQIEAGAQADEMFDAKVKVLGEYIDHHVKEEKNEMFPKARSNRKLDLVGMREQLMERKEELMGEETA